MKTQALLEIIKPIEQDINTPWIPLSWVSIARTTIHNPEALFRALDACINKNKWICPIRIVPGDDAYYSISKEEIVVPSKEQYKSEEDFYANLLHEMCHSTGSEKYLQRLKPTSFGSKDYATEELISELTAALVASVYGVPKHIKSDSAAYIRSWKESLSSDLSFAEDIFSKESDASNFIIAHLKTVSESL